MGLYASVVLVIGKFVREFFSGISHSIMFEELPNVDRILKLCTDIFLVRETGELELEEDLYAKLIFLYRSPETMIKWTREKTNWYLRTQTASQVNIWIVFKKHNILIRAKAFLVWWKWFLFWQVAQRELTFFFAVKVTLQVKHWWICNSISLKSGLLGLYFSQQYLVFWWTMWRNHLCVSSLREQKRRKSKKEKRHVFLWRDYALPEEML